MITTVIHNCNGSITRLYEYNESEIKALRVFNDALDAGASAAEALNYTKFRLAAYEDISAGFWDHLNP